jgi:aspartyl-tRNA(Asn)/glutamyl-tRNA(Gln) amidotransferase subunit A
VADPVSEPVTLTDAVSALRSGATTSVDLVRRCLAAADAGDGALGSFLDRFDESALEAAAAADDLLAEGCAVGPLHGIPIGIKDILQTAEAPTTAQSLVLDPAWSADGRDAAAVRRLRCAGAVIVGKLSTMEFALGVPDPDKPFPIPRNPWNRRHWTGGSSSGSASAVAAGFVLGALGTDTAGSIRMPAAFCGVTGMMPTYGRVPRGGCVPLSFSLDRIGPLARSVQDCATMLGALAGYDRDDPSSAREPVPDFAGGLTADLDGIVVGYDALAGAAGALEDPAVRSTFDAALDVLADAGAQLRPVQLPLYDEMAAAHFVIMLSEALAYHLPDLQSRWDDYFASTRNSLAAATFFSGSDYTQAQRARSVGRAALASLFEQVDLVATPTASSAAPAFRDLDEPMRGRSNEWFTAVHTAYWDVLGNPAMSVPMGFTASGLPLGLQLAGRPFDDAGVLRAGHAYQARTSWHLELPPLAPPQTA